MRVNYFLYSFSKSNSCSPAAWKYAWDEIWELEISKWLTQDRVYRQINAKFKEKELNLKTWIFTTSTQKKKLFGICWRTGKDWYVLQNCRDENFKFFFNEIYRAEIGYILDAIIYIADQSLKVKTINPQVTKDIKKERVLVYEKNNQKRYKTT